VTLLEVSLDDIAGAFLAEELGADRIELCAGLIEGGTTPSLGTVATVLGGVERIGVRVLVRQRGGDFVYTADELDAMCADIEAIRALPIPSGVELGFVIGALLPSGEIDTAATTRLVEACGPAPTVFHKAFDQVQDQSAALEILIGLGVGGVLTSGGAPRAIDAAEALSALVRQAAGRIVILAGGGVRPENVAELVASTGVTEVHLRAAESVPSASAGGQNQYDSGERLVTSGTIITGMRDALSEGAQR